MTYLHRENRVQSSTANLNRTQLSQLRLSFWGEQSVPVSVVRSSAIPRWKFKWMVASTAIIGRRHRHRGSDRPSVRASCRLSSRTAPFCNWNNTTRQRVNHLSSGWTQIFRKTLGPPYLPTSHVRERQVKIVFVDRASPKVKRPIEWSFYYSPIDREKWWCSVTRPRETKRAKDRSSG